MSTETERTVYSRESCIDAAAEVLARYWAETTAAPTEARAAV